MSFHVIDPVNLITKVTFDWSIWTWVLLQDFFTYFHWKNYKNTYNLIRHHKYIEINYWNILLVFAVGNFTLKFLVKVLFLLLFVIGFDFTISRYLIIIWTTNSLNFVIFKVIRTYKSFKKLFYIRKVRLFYKIVEAISNWLHF